MGLDEQIRDDGGWYVQLSAILALVFAFMQLWNVFLFVVLSVPFSFLFLVFFSNLVSIMQMEWLMIPACPHSMCKITRATLKGPIVQKSVDVCVVLYLCMD